MSVSGEDGLSKQLNEFGERLKNQRVRLGDTQPDLAARLGCKRQTLSAWEKGETTPDVKTLFRLKEVARERETNPVEINLGELLGERNVDAGKTPLEYAINFLRKLDAMGIRDVHLNRSDALVSFLPFLESEQQSVSIVASSFMGVTRVAPSRVATAIERMAKRVKDFKILMTHPDMSKWRETQEGRAEGSIEQEIMESVKLLERWGVPPENIKFWRGAPTIFLLFTPERMIANAYPLQTEAFKSFTLEIAPTHSQEDVYFQYSLNHFIRPWKSSNAVPVSEVRNTLVQ